MSQPSSLEVIVGGISGIAEDVEMSEGSMGHGERLETDYRDTCTAGGGEQKQRKIANAPTDETIRDHDSTSDIACVRSSQPPAPIDHKFGSEAPLTLSSSPSPIIDNTESITAQPKDKAKAKATTTKKKQAKVRGDDGPEPKKEKKVLYAKEVFWNDMPDWQGNNNCPLLELPTEIMDRCFGLQEHIELADYVSLAGVSQFFRHHLDDTFFKAACHERNVDRTHYGTFPPIRPPESELIHAIAPFSHAAADWRQVPPRKKTFEDLRRDSYTPAGDRSMWKKSQYDVYKEEKAAWKAKHRAVLEAKAAELEIEAKKNREAAAQRVKTIREGLYNRTILAPIQGRRHGEPAIAKDERGLPLRHPESQGVSTEHVGTDQGGPAISAVTDSEEGTRKTREEQDDTPSCVRGKASPKGNTAAAVEATDIGAISVTSCKRSLSDDATPNTSRPRKKRKPKSQIKSSLLTTWTAPETDSETEIDPVIKYDKDGQRVFHDIWPSFWRSRAADYAKSSRITKTEALKVFKVAEAELITLQHVLIHNPMSSKSPKQLFVRAAVRALAFRAHGGVWGHHELVAVRNTRATKAAATRQANVEKAEADGIYKRLKPRIRVAPYNWRWRHEMWGYQNPNDYYDGEYLFGDY